LEGLSIDDFSARLRHLSVEQCKDLTFENVQARVRTSILMNTGFVVGTGDVSEMALGWTTYNADHMSMYNPNSSIPKTLVKFLVGWAARNEFAGEVRRTLLDVVDTVISPELLPTDAQGTPPQAALWLRWLNAQDGQPPDPVQGVRGQGSGVGEDRRGQGEGPGVRQEPGPSSLTPDS